jgi:hypothetical protein
MENDADVDKVVTLIARFRKPHREFLRLQGENLELHSRLAAERVELNNHRARAGLRPVERNRRRPREAGAAESESRRSSPRRRRRGY